MIERIVAGIVDRAQRYAVWVLLACLLLVAASGFYAAQHFSITTNVTDLLDEKAAWRQREIVFSKAFPQRDDLTVVVIDGKNSVDTDLAAATLLDAIKSRPDLFRGAKRPETNAYFQQNGLMLLPEDDLMDVLDGLVKAQPLLASLAVDPSPRGLFDMASLMLDGLQAGQTTGKDLAPFFNRVTQALRKALDNPADEKAWDYLLASENPGKFELRRFILAQPVLDYSALTPGDKASSFLRGIIAEKKLAETYNVTVRLTGPVPLADDEFASLSEGMGVAMLISVILIYLILYSSLKSWRLIVPIFITLLAGLAITTAAALLMVGSLNLISVAFAVMFTGIAVDFGIQFGVRYRDARLSIPDLAGAMKHAAYLIAVPLLLAALSTALGFLSFTPTSYRGVAELGLIAGSGMIIAFILNITLLPALLRMTQPGPEKEAVGFQWMKAADDYLISQRKKVLTFFTVLFAACAALAFFLPFDFDPLNLKDRKAESVATMFDLIKDPDSSPYTVDILADNLDAAEAVAEKLRALPEVDKAITLSSLVPDMQDEKIALIADTASLLAPGLNPSAQKPFPTLAESTASAQKLAEKISEAKEVGDEAKELLHEITRFSALTENSYNSASGHMKRTVTEALGELRQRLAPEKITLDDIPTDLRGEWVTADGAARIEVMPKGDAHDPHTLVNFVAAVRSIAPEAGGAAVSIQESAATIKQAFIEAGIYSTVAIFILLLILLRNVRHTLFVLVPLILAFALTLGTATAVNLPINFANIIALPLLLGLGVSYAIYFVVYWTQGFASPLQSGMARAVLSSAATALVAFGSLSVSNHPGTASMGLLLALSLFYVLFTTFLFLPALLGKPIKSDTK